MAARKIAFGRVEKALYKNKFLKIRQTRLPDFLCIGARKAGTTWLYENLRQHPQLFLPKRKELQYFNIDFETKSFRSYTSEFKTAHGKTKGEITPSYSIIPVERIEFIHNVIPDVKIIFLMRNPVERAWADSYAYLVTARKRRLEAITDEEFYAHFKSRRCMKRGDYIKIIDTWQNIFPKKQFYMGFSLDIEHRPKKLLQDIFQFLNVTTDIDWNNFPLSDRIIPTYNDHGDVASGHSVRDYTPTISLMPQRFKDFLEELHTPQINALCKRFPEYSEYWQTNQSLGPRRPHSSCDNLC